MLNKIIYYSLHNRLVILVCALLLMIWGTYTAFNTDVDVFPDLNAPTVVIMTEANGMAPEEVERLVTFPVETAVNGDGRTACAFLVYHRILRGLGRVRLGYGYLPGSSDRVRKTGCLG